jgi:tRNA threonylcarbamoyladenosine biosynthesis protein TsaB
MLVLAIDTTTRQGSVALARNGRAVAVYEGDGAVTHGVRLPGDLVRFLQAHDLHIADVDLFAVASGPGSFTGMRIGIATMQGLALANGKPLIGISALDAINDAACSAHCSQPSALSARERDGEVAVWMDAQRGQVFSAVYSNNVVRERALADKPADILSRWAREEKQPALFAGDGALVYHTLIRQARAGVHIVEPTPPLAPSIARLAETALRAHGASTPDAIRPIYVRRTDAELVRDGKGVVKVGTASE